MQKILHRGIVVDEAGLELVETVRQSRFKIVWYAKQSGIEILNNY